MELDFSKQVQDSEKLQKIIGDQKEQQEINSLPDTAFAHIQDGGTQDEMGRTVPRSLRQFPIYNKVHVKRAIEDLAKAPMAAEAKAESLIKIEQRAKTLGMEINSDEVFAAERYNGKTRSELEDSAFLDPKRRSFPVVSCKNVRAAVSTWGMYKGSMTFEEFKRKLTVRAKKLGCESSLPKTWRDESSAKDWEKIDTDELKRDDKKEKKEHHKDAVEDDKDKIKKLEKEKPSEKKVSRFTISKKTLSTTRGKNRKLRQTNKKQPKKSFWK